MTDDQRARYDAMIAAGESPRLAEVLALRAFPSIRGTSSAFMRGTHAQDSAYDAWRHRQAQALGVDTNGRRYLSGLARFPGDPEAWVSDLSDVRRVCEERGWRCEGAVDVEAPPPDVDSAWADRPAVAPDIVERRLADDLEPLDPRDRTARVVEDARDRAEGLLSGRTDVAPPRVSDYEDPFAVAGMEPDA